MSKESTPYAIITGASRGIGREAARVFVREGHRVFNLSRRPCDVEGVTSIGIDLLQPHACDAIRSWARGALPDKAEIVLVHSAAMMVKDRADQLEAESLRTVIELNVVVPAWLNAILVPRMESGSSILYLGSTLSEKAVPFTASYVTTKHALAGLMKATCQDLAGSGIHTVCVCPGFTETEMLVEHMQGDRERLDAVAKLSTFDRLIAPQEIAQTLLFCARNPVLNGAVIHANLGQRAT